MYYYFTKEGFNALNAEIGTICDRIKEAGREMGISCQEGAETFHDNFAYEQGERDQTMWSNRLRQLVKIRNQVRVVDPGQSRGKVSLGRTVTIRDLSSEKERTFRIGSYMVLGSASESGVEVLSYDAPLPKALIGAREGETRVAHFGGRNHHLEVVKVE